MRLFDREPFRQVVQAPLALALLLWLCTLPLLLLIALPLLGQGTTLVLALLLLAGELVLCWLLCVGPHRSP